MQDSLFETHNITQYLSLARKYRPRTFNDMIGQPVLVQTLTNAILNNRTPDAILLTGIRGVGKTTTARIIARALNCVGIDGNSQPTPNPCGQCENCIMITEGRHQDVLEIDAASHTGVADVREIIDNSRYKPISARYKIYIIDEIHMLSNSAFNALLKILEEPPMHVKFIFATTEIRKIPITILSRCQRFDLKRIDVNELTKYYGQLVELEKLQCDQDALNIIANAAQGSVRDGLSILDQALSMSGGKVTSSHLRNMLGLADWSVTFDLFVKIVSGNAIEAVNLLQQLYKDGADPTLIIQDLLDIVHNITKTKIANNKNIYNFTAIEWEKYSAYSDILSIIFLSRAWQMLLKGMEEVKQAISPQVNLEMVIIRILYAAQMPIAEDDHKSLPQPVDIEVSNEQNLAKLLLNNNEMLLYHHLVNDIKVVKFSNCNIELVLLNSAPKNFVTLLDAVLLKLTGKKWCITITQTQEDIPTINELYSQEKDKLKVQLAESDIVKKVLNTFTGTEILDIKIKNNI